MCGSHSVVCFFMVVVFCVCVICFMRAYLVCTRALFVFVFVGSMLVVFATVCVCFRCSRVSCRCAVPSVCLFPHHMFLCVRSCVELCVLACAFLCECARFLCYVHVLCFALLFLFLRVRSFCVCVWFCHVCVCVFYVCALCVMFFHADCVFVCVCVGWFTF